MAETQGIEIFGRGAVVVDTDADSPRGPWLGLLSVVLGLLACTATGLGVVSAAGGAAADAQWLAVAGIGCGILGALIGFVAVAAGRGVGSGLLGMALSLIGNPWILTRLLDWVGSLVGAA